MTTGSNVALHLVASPAQRLAICEETISQHLSGFVAVGLSLKEISEDKLYLLKNGGAYKTFALYCKAVWGTGRAHAYQQIEAAKVAGNLSAIVDITSLSESVLRPLTHKKLRDPDQQRDILARAITHAKTEQRVVTARDVQALVREELRDDYESPYSPIIRPTDDWKFNLPFYGKLPIEEESEHGYICGDFYANCLWYYSHPGDAVVDPMAGSGQLLRVYEDRERWMIPTPWELEIHLFDLTPRGPYQDRIGQHDLRDSFPLRQCDYILLDPPYFGLVKKQYSTKGADLANMGLSAYLQAIDDIARSCSAAQQEGGRCTIVVANHRNFSTRGITLTPHLVTDLFVSHGYHLFDVAYMSTFQQQQEGIMAAKTNNKAKKTRVLRNEICEVLTFLKQ